MPLASEAPDPPQMHRRRMAPRSASSRDPCTFRRFRVEIRIRSDPREAAAGDVGELFRRVAADRMGPWAVPVRMEAHREGRAVSRLPTRAPPGLICSLKIKIGGLPT